MSTAQSFDRALRIARTLGGLAMEAYEALAHNDPKRVESILPDELLTTLEKRLADAIADRKFEAAAAASELRPDDDIPY